MKAERKSKSAARETPKSATAADGLGANPQVASALRSAYDETVRENVPAEFLDLLNKLS